MATFYVATTGNNGNDGSIGSPWLTWQYGFSQLVPGDILYIRGGTYPSGTGTTRAMWDGTYYCGVAISGVDGTSSNLIRVENYPGEVPILDCTTLNKAQFNAGIILYECDYWYLKGLEVQEVEGSSQGCLGIVGVSVNNCTFENLVSHDNGGSGILIEYYSSGNLILNCDCYNNYDTLGGGSNADGIEVSYINYSSPRRTNTIRGCRSWNNSDDGFDFYDNNGYLLVENCWAWHNGYDKGGNTPTGDGNGYKLGRPSSTSPPSDPIYTVINCIAYDHKAGGFTMEEMNYHRVALYNNVAYDNNCNWEAGFQGEVVSGSPSHIIRNNISYANVLNYSGLTGTVDHNSWQVATVTDADFASLTASGLLTARESDGSLPVITFLHLASDSDLIGAGIVTSYLTDGDGETWNNPPSVGAFEYNSGGGTPPTGTVYYVSSIDGDDGNDGLSSLAPWETLSKVNSSYFDPGDEIRFKCGDTFRGYLWFDSSGDSSNQITLTSYGSGDKPKIWNSYNASSSLIWTNYSGNIWCTISAISSSGLNDCGVVTFNNEASYGIKNNSLGGCASQGEYYFNPSDNRLYLYSTSNPGTYYSHIEVGGIYAENALTIYADYVTIDGLNVQYGANNGIFVSSGFGHAIIQNCELCWIGGMYYGTTYGMGNAIQMWEWVNDVIIRYNYIHDIYDTGVSPQGNGTYTQSDISIYYNIFERCNWTYEVFVGGDTNTRTLTNILFENNTCLSPGSWSNSWRPDTDSATHVRTWQEANGIRTNLTIKNNIFDGSTYPIMKHYYSNVFDTDYNLYGIDAYWLINTTYYYSLSSWQTQTGDDSHSLEADPLVNSDFTLQSGSPAIDAGTDLGYVRDYFGTVIIGYPTIGAYQNPYSVPTEYYSNLVIEGHSFVYSYAPGINYLTGVANYSTYHNLAVGGSEIEDVEARAATCDSYLITETATAKNILLLWIGVNDLSYIVGEGTTHYYLLKNYVLDRVAAGWKVFAFTITPSDAYGRGAQFEIERQAYNNLMLTDLNSYENVYVINTDSNEALVDIDNTYYWPEEPGGGALHPSEYAIQIASTLFETLLTGYWGSLETPEPDFSFTMTGAQKFYVI